MSDSGVHPCFLAEDELLRECDIRRQRRSGPGGQHRNKVETAVVVIHRPTGIQGEASERRSQHQNQQMAVFRLRINLALHVRTAGYDPGQWSQRRDRSGGISVSPSHADFPAWLATVLNVLVQEQMNAQQAAERLGITTSQLVRVLKHEPRALEQLNQSRQQLGLRPLK